MAILGTPQIQAQNKLLTAELVSAKGQALLIFLALNPGHHARSALAGLLWGDLTEASARANLRLTLSRLRPHLPADLLLISRPEVALDSAGVALDCQAFRAGLQAAQRQLTAGSLDLDALSATLALYRGECAAGFTVLHAPEFESWLLNCREAERQYALSALFDLTRQAIGRQAAEAGLLLAHKLVTLEPWHEEGQYQLIYLLAVSGQRGAALAQFERCREQLAAELGVAPAAATLALYKQIQNGDLQPWLPAGPPPTPALAPRPPARHNLPTTLTPFIGREWEQEALTQLLAGPERLVTLLGEGGLGKTRLALVTARMMLDSFANGVWFVPLAEQEPAGTGQAAAPEDKMALAIATAMNLTFAGASSPAAQLATYLQPHQLLLILDNFESWQPATGLIRQLLQAAPRLTILVTSREPLQLQAEHIFRLEGLPLPAGGNWADGQSAASIQLFADRARRAAGQELLTETTLPIITKLCGLVNGLPLGIELMAHWCRWLPLDLIAADLPTYLLSLDAPLDDLPARHRSLRAVFSYSWQLLSADERLLLAQLTIFRGSFSLASIGPVTGNSPALLFSLLNKSLVQRQAADRYQLHELLRAFAQEKENEVGLDMPALAQRHGDYYLGRLHHFAAELNGPRPLQALREASADLPNLQQGWHWATTKQQWAALGPAISGMLAVWQFLGQFREAAASFGRAIAHALAADQADPAVMAALAALYGERAHFFYELGELAEMKSSAEAAICWSERAGLAGAAATGRLRLGQCFWRLGQYEDAAEHLLQAETLAQQAGLTSLEGQIARTLAVNAWRLGDLTLAQKYGERSLQLHEQNQELRHIYRGQHLLAILAQNQHRLAEAEAYLRPMLAAATRLNDRPAMAAAYGLFGQIARYGGRYEEALHHYSQELTLEEEMGRQWSIAANAGNLGDLYAMLGQFERAETLYDQSLTIFRRINDRMAISNVLAYKGLLAFWQEEFARGQALSEEALQLAQQTTALREQTMAYTFLAYNLSGLNHWVAAGQNFALAAQGWQQLGDQPGALEAQAGLARALLVQGDLAGARTALTPVLAPLANVSLAGAKDPAQIYLTCFAVLAAAGDAAAPGWLRAGQAFLTEKAAAIQDQTLRNSYLGQIPANRELMYHPRHAMDR